MTVTSDPAFLDDPATVYPVIIDPQVDLGQTRVLRVTTAGWTKWGSAVGSHGKLGYNGWTAPYYKSRMFYQFAWPTSQVLTRAAITKGVFEYVQDHSPQHSPCETKSTGYVGIRARLANAIESSDTWNDRTGDAWHPQNSVISYMAVGHEDYCNDTYRQTWNLTGAMQEERGLYPTRLSVTVGLYSDDESNAMGWRHYINDAGYSPKLELTFEGPPPVPTGVAVAPAGNGTGLVATSTTPRLSATVSLETGTPPDLVFECRDPLLPNCISAEFTLTSAAGTIHAKGDGVSSSGGVSTTPTLGTALDPALAYSVTARTCNAATGLCSAWTQPATLTVDLPPAAPSLKWAEAAWPNKPSPPLNTPLDLEVVRAGADTDIQRYEVTVKSKTLSDPWVVAPLLTVPKPAGLTGFPVSTTITVGGFLAQTTVTVEVVAIDGRGSRSGLASKTLTVAFG